VANANSQTCRIFAKLDSRPFSSSAGAVVTVETIVAVAVAAAVRVVVRVPLVLSATLPSVVEVSVAVAAVVLVDMELLVVVPLLAVVLVRVLLTVVTVAVIILISGGVTPNEVSTMSKPCNWKLDCKADVKFEGLATTWLVALKSCSAESIGATTSNSTSHELETDRADEDATDTES